MLKTLSFLVLTASVAIAQTQVADPLSNEIPTSSLGVKLEKQFRVPSSGSNPNTRIISLREPDDGTGRLFVADQRGELWVSVDGMSTPTLFVDLSSEFSDFVDSPGLGTGFASFDFHPDFATNGKFYTAHSDAANSKTADVPLPAGGTEKLQGVVTEWTVNNPSANTWSGTRRELLRVEIVGTLHGMQEISFNKSAKQGDDDYGMLYIALGDGGAYNDKKINQAYRLDGLLGTVMRIDPMGTNGRNGKYGIPASNPLVDGNSATYDEIYAWGFRNPHRFSWDLGGNHAMLLGNIGEDNIEEVELIEAGLDYGWGNREGTFLFQHEQNPTGSNNGRQNRSWVYTLPANDASFGYTYPVAQYDHYTSRGVHEWTAICGGYVYRGSAIPSMSGQYIFGDIFDGLVYVVPVNNLVLGQAPAAIEYLNLYDDNDSKRSYLDMIKDSGPQSRADLRFGQDLSGEIYVMSKRDRWVRKMVKAANDTVTDTWAGFPIKNIEGQLWADTSGWLGWVEVSQAGTGWIYAASLDSWIYMREDQVTASGAWGYALK